MGTIYNHTTIIIGNDIYDERPTLQRVLKHIADLKLPRSEPLIAERNGTWTIVIPTTGSKLGWGLYEDREEAINKLITEIQLDAEITYKPEIIQTFTGEASPEITVV